MPLRGFTDTLRRILSPSGPLREQAITSGIWATLINVFDRVLQITKLIVLANILTPADFGLMGVALLTLAILRQFSQLGIDTALIQRQESNVDEYLNTVWSTKIARGVVIGSIAFVLSPFAAQFFGEPRAANILRVVALSPLILGLQNPGVVYFKKNLEFHKEFVYTLGGTLVNVSVAVVFALVYRDVWALVVGLIAGNFATVALSYLIHEYRPWFEFNREYASELFNYGKWITASGIILFLLTQGDDVFVGWFLTAAGLGFYQMAYRFSNAPATEITHVISNVTLPTYSSIQDDESKLQEGFFTALQLTTFLAAPAAVGIFVTSRLFVNVFLGEQWSPIVVTMQVLSFFAITRAIGAVDGPMLKAIGRPDIATKFQSAQLVLMALLIYPFTSEWGITGAALAVTASILFPSVLKGYVTVRQIKGSYLQYARTVSFPLLCSFLMGLAVYGTDRAVDLPSQSLEFSLLVILGIMSYVSFTLVLQSISSYDITETLQSMLQSAAS